METPVEQPRATLRHFSGHSMGRRADQWLIGNRTVEIGLRQNAGARHQCDPEIGAARKQCERNRVIRVLDKVPMLRDHGHRRVDRAERGAHDPDAAWRDAGIDQARPWAGEIGPRRLVRVRPDMPCRNGDPIETERAGIAFYLQGRTVSARFDVRDPAIFPDRDDDPVLAALFDQPQQLVVEILAEQDARKELPVVQCFLVDTVAAELVCRLGAQPIEIGRVDRRDFDAGDIGEHQPRVRVIIVGNPHSSTVTLLEQRNRNWSTLRHQRGNRVGPWRPRPHNIKRDHIDPPQNHRKL